MPRLFESILQPIRLGKLEIRNRVAMAPMGIPGLLNPDGSPGQRAIDYYIERARGGVGLIISGVFKVENDIENHKPGVAMVSDKALSPFAELAEAVHALGAKIFVQLTAGFGRVTGRHRLQGHPVSASAVSYFWQPDIACRALTTEEVERLVRCFGTAVQILTAAGIDGVELHGHEGYLFDQFTTAIWNQRTDKYGGDLAGRLRLPLEVLNEIKDKAGRDFHVQYRFGLKHYIKGLNRGALPGEDYLEAGRDVEEGLAMAKSLAEAGFDALHVDAGCYDSWYWPHPPIYQAHGCMVDMAAAVKKALDIPVIGVGRLDIPELAETVLQEGKADMVALGRALLTDPLWVRKVEQGQPERIRPCIGCFDGCMGRIFAGKPLCCAVNPQVGRERTYAVGKTDGPKRIIVVGGGVAGLEAARTAALRGHHVTLYEKSNTLGGNLLPASVPSFKQDLKRLLAWYESKLQDVEVDVTLGFEATSDFIESETADRVIIATGARPIVPSIPGIEQENVLTASEVLLGKKKIGDRVVVVGGGLVGCETAIWLAQRGKKVTLVEMFQELMAGSLPVPHMTRLMITDMLAFNRVEVLTETRPLEITDDAVLLRRGPSEEESLQADTVVLSLGLNPDKKLYDALVGKIPNLYLIGDSREARNVMGAIWDAYEVARAI